MNKKKRALALLLILSVISTTCIFAAASGADPLPTYYYSLECVDDGVKTESKTGGTVILNLYVNCDNNYSNVIDGGSFGLRFPANLSGNVSFSPNNEAYIPDGKGAERGAARIHITDIVPQARYTPDATGILLKDSYLAFSWTRSESTVQWDISPKKGFNMFLGTITMDVGTKVPTKTSVGLLDWLQVDEAEATELPEAERPEPALDLFNTYIWNADTAAYQGYYLDNATSTGGTVAEQIENSALSQTDLPLIWSSPTTWADAFSILSYDPKKQTTVELYDEGKNLVMSKLLDTWSADENGEDPRAFTALEKGMQNRNKGYGLYEQAVDLEKLVTDTGSEDLLVADKTYYLVIRKESHLPVEVELKTISTNLAEAEGLPTDAVYLPCGDINPQLTAAEVTSCGDGAIKMADRSVLLAFLNGAQAVVDPLSKELDGKVNLAYYADLNGDGKLTLADLDILTSAVNYNTYSQLTIG